MFDKFYADLLQLFADGGAGTGESPAAEGTTGEAPAAAGQEETAEEAFARFTEKYGEDAKPLRDHHQKNFGKKYATFKETEARAQRLDGFMKTVAMRYPDVDATNPDALEEAFLNDTRFHDKRAYETGEDAKTLLDAEKKDMELAKLRAKDKAEKVQKEKEAAAKRFHEQIIAQEKELKKKYPDFSFEEEIKNPEMRKKLGGGYSLEDAYRSVHYDEFLQKAVTDAKAATVSSIASGSTRPSEGAAAAAAPSTAKVDYSKMSNEEFMEIYNKKFRT